MTAEPTGREPTITVPLLDGRLVYAVLEGDETGLVVVLRYQP